MPLIRKLLTSKTAMVQFENWAFKVFCISTFFIVVFSIQAIYIWPPVAEKLSILLACVLPTGMVVFCRIQIWFKEKQVPKELTWVLLVFLLGLFSCLFSENPWISLKSMVLFIVSGPFIFITSKYLLESTKNQEVFLWMTSLGILVFSFVGIFEYLNLKIVYLFSRNPLPAGALLILLSAGPLILSNKPRSLFIKFALIFSLTSAAVLIILMAKKSHLLGLMVLCISLIVFVYRRYFKFLLGFIFLAGLALYSSDSLRLKYKNMINWNDPTPTISQSISEPAKQEISFAIYGSIPLRAENYFFASHVIKKNPFWGLGFKANFDPYFDDYKISLDKYLSKKQYQDYINSYTTFENIVVTYLVDWGGLFSFIYFGGMLYIVAINFKKIRTSSLRDLDRAIVFSVIIGFTVISLTFDTLRFPNLNWVFHSLLGLLVNLPNKQLQPPIK